MKETLNGWTHSVCEEEEEEEERRRRRRGGEEEEEEEEEERRIRRRGGGGGGRFSANTRVCSLTTFRRVNERRKQTSSSET